MARKKSIDYDKVAELYAQGMADQAIADAASCNISSVQYWRQQRKLPSHKRDNPAKGVAKAIEPVPEQYICYTQPRINLSFDMTVAKLCIQRWNEGADIVEIADEFCISDDEALCLIHSLAIDGKIKRRQKGIMGLCS